MANPSTQRLHANLTTKDLVIYGITFMIPVAPLAFYGSFLEPANGMVALAYLIGMIAMLFTGFSYASMAAHYPYAGSVYTYVQQGTTPALGFLAGWGITLDYFLIPTITYLITQSFGHALFPTIPGWIWILILVILNTWVNLVGVNLVSKISWLLFGLQAFVLLWFLIGTLVLLLHGSIQVNAHAFYNPTHFNLPGVLQATGIVIVSYLGFDAISTLSEEAAAPQRSIGRAILFSIIGIGLLFVVVTLFAGFVVPEYQKLNPDTAFLTILQQVGGPWLVKLAEVTIILSFGFASGQEGQTAISRLLFAMGRDGILPRRFAKLSQTYHTPYLAILFVGGVSFVLALTLSATTVSNLVSFGALFGFLSLNLAVIWKFFIRVSTRSLRTWFVYLLSPLIGFSVSLWIFLSLSTPAKLVGFAWLIIGLLILLLRTRFFRRATPTLDFSNPSTTLNEKESSQ